MSDITLRVCRDFPKGEIALKLKQDCAVSTVRDLVAAELKFQDKSDAARYAIVGCTFGRDAIELNDDKKQLSDYKCGNGSTIFFRAPADLKPNFKAKPKKAEKQDSKEGSIDKFKGLNEATAFKTFDTTTGPRRQTILEYIETNAKTLFNKAANVAMLSPKSLVEIVQSEYLNIPETALFDACVAWGKAELKKKNAKDEPAELKKVLADVLPWIRFPTMETQDIATKVNPSGLLPNEAILALFQHVAQSKESKSENKKEKKGDKKELPKVGGFISVPRKPKLTASLEFSWDSTKLTSEIQYSQENQVANKLSSSPDVSICIGNRGFRTGKHGWDVRINGLFDEMWVGVTDDPGMVNTVKGNEVRAHNRMWGYKDGSRSDNAFHCAGKTESKIPEPYKAGDTIGVLLDLDNRTMRIYKNGKEQSVCTTLPSGHEFWPIVVMDQANDRIELLKNSPYNYL